MRYLFLVLLITINLFAIEKNDKLFECTKVFEDRKNELLVELERIDEQKQALDALKVATEELLKKKENDLNVREAKIDEKYDDVNKKEASIKAMLEENKKVLETIKNTKMDKISQTYSKMKPAAAAGVLADMDENIAVKILASLKPAIVGKILTKMDPQKASKLTIMLTKTEAQ
ncbi:PDP protein [Sulfurimonas sp. HSL-1716]|uniref:MotE family protein n=1 Tax=Hydrocurvibacter sulfurireducens TaxID=3131937 RepID=UPI0031F8815E